MAKSVIIPPMGVLRRLLSNYSDLSKKVGWNSNRNLLDNGWFIVNERGATTITSTDYCVNRWIGTNLTIASNGITSTANGSTLKQRLLAGLKDSLVGKKVVLSVKMSDGTIESGCVTYAKSATTIFNGTNMSGATDSSGDIIFTFKASNKRIVAVKFEVGEASSLGNDTLPSYAIEILNATASMADAEDSYAGRPYLTYTVVNTFS